MNEILYTNIFFIITSIASLIFLIFVCVILFNIIKVLQLVRGILERIDKGSQVLSEDLTRLRAGISNFSFLGKVFNFFQKKEKNKPSSRKIPAKKTAVKKSVKTKSKK